MPSAPSWPFVKPPGALVLTAIGAVCPPHPAPVTALDGFRPPENPLTARLIDTVKAASLALKNRATSPSFTYLSGELLSLGLGVRFRAPGTSMHPTIRHGDLITVEPAAPASLKKGDIILYILQSGFIAHRIVDIKERIGCGPTFILRGDASAACDQPVKAGQVLGKVVCLERGHRIIDPYSLRVRLWRMLYLWFVRAKRRVSRWFSPQSTQSAPREFIRLC